jgi:formylglycine-generating enzyme required for sulfatase activity/CRP-like cAMP-binding protein/chromosome segregation ATPase
MRAAKKARIDRKVLHDLVPLNALSESRFGTIAEKIHVEEIKAGHYLFRKGDRDGKSVYLLEGKISLIDSFRKVTGEVEAGSDISRYPIANLQPRALSAKAAKKSVIAYIDSNLLDVFLTCDQTQTADVVEISGADTGDWMTRILQSEVFSKLPPAKIQSLLMKMRPFQLEAGETVISQGDEGDYFYTIHEGRCAVTRREAPDGEDVLLAELGEGDSFGEDALVSNTRRNATVTMLTNGTLMRLAKRDFVELLKKQLVRHIDCKTARAMVEEGAVWLDVRTPDEYERGSFEDSVNIPLAGLREELSELVFNATYILCCDTGGRSGSAAFMLSHKGYDVYVLEGGITALTSGELEAAGMSQQYGAVDNAVTAGTDHKDAEVISFETGRSCPEPSADAETVADVCAGSAVQTAADAGDDNVDASPDQARLLAELQQEKLLLAGELENYRNTEQRLTEQLELLRAELAEAGGKLGEFYSHAKSDADEKQLLRDQYAALQEEFNEQQRAYESKQEEAVRRIDEIQSQLDSARQEAHAGTEAVTDELGNALANNDLLREELTAAMEKVRSLEEQLAATLEAESGRAGEAAVALQEQQDYVQQLQSELQQLGDTNKQLQQSLDAGAEQDQTASNELRNRLQEMEGRFVGLSGELEEVRGQLARKEAELDDGVARIRELDQANRDLHASLESARHSITQLQTESGGTLQEQQVSLDELRSELAATLDTNEHLRQELEETVAVRDRLREEFQARLDEADGRAAQAGEELADLQRQLGETADRLAAEHERGENLQQQNNERASLLESLQAEIEAARSESESAATTARERQQTLEEELNELRSELAGITENSREAVFGLESATETVQTLEQEKTSLNAALQEAEARLAEQREHAAVLESEKQAAVDALSGQEEKNDAERRALGEQLQAAQDATVKMQADLEAGLEEYNAERQRLEDELEQQLARNSRLLAEHEAGLSALLDAKAESDEALALLQAEQQELQQKYAEEQEDKSGLLARVEEIEGRSAAELADKERQIEDMQASFLASREEIDSLRLTVEENNAQLEALQLEISEREENRRLIEEELESSREQNKQLRLEMEQYEQCAREAEEEYQESIRKAHDDLTRKNDYERELQGQIDRLRKQLEQATLDQHKQRESAQDDLDNLREQLHAERRARAEERAEMAARQRELKEQLASIANEHEVNLGRRSGALEQVRDEVRAEEQERLREILEAQAQTEDQVLKLQQELSRAHEEISELTLQQKSVRQVNVDLLQEQNQQAVSTIAQLESQLRQLSEERDSALEEQTGLRDRVNALRGEVEVARGLMNMHGQGQAENPARLRSELEEAKKNVEIAVRLRAEAEAARDRVLRERDQLRSRLASGDERSEQPQADAVDQQPVATLEQVLPDVPGSRQVAVDQDRHAGIPTLQIEAGGLPVQARNRSLVPAIGLGVTGIVALVIWLMLGAENPLPDAWQALLKLDEAAPDNTAAAVVVDSPVSPAGDPARVADGARQEVVMQPGTAVVAATPVRQEKTTEDKDSEAVRAAAVRSFRDALQGGIKGPVMMELPAGDYKMGSLGNSLNYDESPRHKVTLTGFSIGKYEVTFAEYDTFARATGRRLPYDESWGRANRPVINVSWSDAVAYTEWLSSQSGKSYRLPTESEWEYAIRAGGGSRHWWDAAEAGIYANCFNCGSEWDNRQTSPVGSFPANSFGLHDMAGNVQEWTQDCYQTGYADAPADGSAWLTPQCTQRAVRGGGYTSPLDSLRSAKRGQYDQDTRLDNIGFRVVRDN